MSFDYRQSIPSDHPALAGHFPGNPVVPGVVLLDLVREGLSAWQPDQRISGIRQVKFMRALLPEQALDMQLEIQSGRLLFRGHHGEDLILQGEATLGVHLG
ncbi:MAG: hydroxymyristoyl-ACP dehydratase [Gammaproteobacteria bacterium]|nr:hydroxymyristoyl-ACP dehydratase [Gammaproteobacteria bacterium]